MARSNRQLMILELIKKNFVNTQEELVQLLKQQGFNATQATISRDIKELGLTKTMTANRTTRYTYVPKEVSHRSDKLATLFKESVISIVHVGNLIVLKTLPGTASSSAGMIDRLELSGILGSIAGDDTIFVAVSDEIDAAHIVDCLNNYTK